MSDETITECRSETRTVYPSLAEKLARVQCALAVPKDCEVKDWQGKTQYRYRNAETILEAVKPIALANRCTIKVEDMDPMLVAENVSPVWFTDNKGVQHQLLGPHVYIPAVAYCIDWDSDAVITAKSTAREAEYRKGLDPSQQTGSTSSYARKYALCGLLAIDGNKDADQLAAEAPEVPENAGPSDF